MALQTLLYPFENDKIDWPDETAKTVFFGARHHQALKNFKNLHCLQHFYPYAKNLETTEEPPKDQDLALILLPKNKIESVYEIARALQSLKEGGLLIVAADNNAGGKTLKKMLEKFGLSDIQTLSKHKAKVAWGNKVNINENEIAKAIKAGDKQSIQPVPPPLREGARGRVPDAYTFISQPGIYGWNKIDKGSALLIQNLPDKLEGHGADFGCGYGFLSAELLKNHTPKSLTCIDADQRALTCCKSNIEKNSDFQSEALEIVPSDREASEGRKTNEAVRLNYIWDDLKNPDRPLKNLNFILMNPPFHEGKKTDISIGQSFIKTAHESLRKNGVLYMVANAHLPYEHTLKNTFTTTEKIFEAQGFKLLKSTK